jgi:L-fuculose-phosphate aldolase
VVHVHSRHAVALAASGVERLPVSHEANYLVEHGVPRFKSTGDLTVTSELGLGVAKALGDASAALSRQSRIVYVGPDVETATVTAIALERACVQQLITNGYEPTT